MIHLTKLNELSARNRMVKPPGIANLDLPKHISWDAFANILTAAKSCE